ncbi:hypothetical protein HDU77_009907 [Chytriomyces hyalinus]|nr:hypothetical protein HDU77_009907 [Chytriomyces hyalinus]
MSIIAVLVLTVAARSANAFCTPTQNSCQIQSDPFVQPFIGETFSLENAGQFFAVDSAEMKVQVNIVSTFAPNLKKEVHVVNELRYSCGGSAPQTFTTRALTGKGPMTLSCDIGTCARTTCRVVILPGLDPVPNVQIQQIQYMGTRGNGGLCFQNDRQCQTVSGGGERPRPIEPTRPIEPIRPRPNTPSRPIETPRPNRPYEPSRPNRPYEPSRPCSSCGGNSIEIIEQPVTVYEVILVPEVIEIVPRICESFGLSYSLGTEFFEQVLTSSSYGGYYNSYVRAANVDQKDSQTQAAFLIGNMTSLFSKDVLSASDAGKATSQLAVQFDVTEGHVSKLAEGVVDALKGTSKDVDTTSVFKNFMALGKAASTNAEQLAPPTEAEPTGNSQNVLLSGASGTTVAAALSLILLALL